MRESVRQIMAGIAHTGRAKRIANNTVEYVRASDGAKVIRLHHTDIVSYEGDSMVLNTGGWQTVTTKERLNRFTRQRGVSIYSDKGQWRVCRHSQSAHESVPYRDGMRIGPKGKLPAVPESVQRDGEALANRIRKFVAKLTEENLPQPDLGDCFLCAFKDEGGQTMGQHGGADSDRDHILAHIREGYLHGALIVNAMQWAGYRRDQIALHYQMRLITTMRSALRRYLRAKVGLAR